MHTIAEYLSYQYETPASGPFPGREWGRGLGGAALSELPLKQNDHAMDATRYALHTALGQALATQTYLASYLSRRHRE